MLYGTLVLVSSDDLPDAPYTVNLDGTATTNFLSSLFQPATVLNADRTFPPDSIIYRRGRLGIELVSYRS